ncbi:MAG: helix-turn-helix transcriptional regulator [Bacteroidota bacterium]
MPTSLPVPAASIQRVSFHHSAGQASAVDVARASEVRAREMDHSPYAPTRLDFHLIQFVTEGQGQHWVDFEPVALRQGDLLYVHPDQVHAFDADAQHEAWLLMFLPDALPRTDLFLSRLRPWGRVVTPSAQDFLLLVQLLDYLDHLNAQAAQVQPEAVAPHVLGALLAGLSSLLAAREQPVDVTTQRYEALTRAFETRLAAHLRRSRSPAWYAAALGTTPRTLARACHHTRGQAPKRLIDVRVGLEARRLLATTSDTVEAIGFRLGFSEATNFVKFFKRVVGITPEAFRLTQRFVT